MRSIEQTIDDGFIVGGYSDSPKSGNKEDNNINIGDYWILKLTKNGDIEWQRNIGGDKDDKLCVIHQTFDNKYIVGGSSNSNSGIIKTKINSNGTDFWVLKLDEKGDILWQETYNFGNVDILTSLIENEDHTFLLGGFAQTELPVFEKLGLKQKNDKKGVNDYIALKINEKGEEIWSKTIGSNGEDVLKKALETRDGGYLLAGTSNSSKSRDRDSAIGSNDFWVVKLKDTQKPDIIKPRIEAIPNPTLSFTNVIVGYDFESGTATLVDMTGRILKQLEITSRTIPIDLSPYPEGIYVVNIKTNVQSDGVKIIKGTSKN